MKFTGREKGHMSNDQDDFGMYHPEPDEKKSKASLDAFLESCRQIVANGWWDYDSYADYDLPKEPDKKEVKCECGSDAIKALVHSDWCPKYKKPERG